MAIGTITKSVSSATVAERLSSASIRVSTFVIQPIAGNALYIGANTGRVFIGTSTVDTTGTTGIQLSPPVAGVTPPSFSMSSGSNNNIFDLRDIWIAVTEAGDGVVVFYHTV